MNHDEGNTMTDKLANVAEGANIYRKQLEDTRDSLAFTPRLIPDDLADDERLAKLLGRLYEMETDITLALGEARAFVDPYA